MISIYFDAHCTRNNRAFPLERADFTDDKRAAFHRVYEIQCRLGQTNRRGRTHLCFWPGNRTHAEECFSRLRTGDNPRKRIRPHFVGKNFDVSSQTRPFKRDFHWPTDRLPCPANNQFMTDAVNLFSLWREQCQARFQDGMIRIADNFERYFVV